MANDWCDGFLQLVKDGQPVEGECNDGDFVGAIEFQSFRFGDSGGFTDSDSGFYAEQNAGNRGSSALSRAQDANPFGGVASLFGGNGLCITLTGVFIAIRKFRGNDSRQHEARSKPLSQLCEQSNTKSRDEAVVVVSGRRQFIPP